MIILGVDPGTLVTGYGVLEVEGSSVTVLDFGVIINRNQRSMPIRLKEIYSKLCAIITKYHPDEFAIETAFYGKNAQSALKLGHARGVSMLAAVNFEVPTSEYSPREVKKAVVGNGAASKDQVKYMVKSLLGLHETPKLFDATDALAVALCHYQSHRAVRSRRNGTATQKSWSAFVKANPNRVVKTR
ncbi:MAG TPA: crossover junction endodeoxyribonuclease RuvC [Bacteroidota bacterium]|nr:crossover junction endodeoxyribonuclease RuvC [Bacteroidota bacterium]